MNYDEHICSLFSLLATGYKPAREILKDPICGSFKITQYCAKYFSIPFCAKFEFLSWPS